MTWIYGLADPETQKIRYIGQTLNMEKRFAGHLSSNNDSLISQWIKNLHLNGKRPTVVILEEVDKRKADARERYWIRYHRQKGSPLLNIQVGRRELARGICITTIHMPPTLRQTIETEVEHRKSIGLGASVTAFCLEAIEYYIKHRCARAYSIRSIKLDISYSENLNAYRVMAEDLLDANALIGERYLVNESKHTIFERTPDGFEVSQKDRLIGTIIVERNIIDEDIPDTTDLLPVQTSMVSEDTPTSKGLSELQAS